MVKYRRNLTDKELQEYFDNHKKLHTWEIDKLFGVKNLSKEQYRWLCKGYRKFTTFDIEALDFHVRMGFMICWYALRWDILTDKREIIYDCLEPEDMKKGYDAQSYDFDTRILGTLSDELKEADVVNGHYISKFDLPYFTSRCHITKQDKLIPDYNDYRVIDTWRITKTKYNLYNSGGNSLRNAGSVILGNDDKTSVDLKKWMTMRYKSHPKWPSCRKYICNHCEIDVVQNHGIFLKQMKRIPVGGSSV